MFFPSPSKVWLDGELLPWEKAKVHVMLHGLHYGTSVFEGIRFYRAPEGKAIFRLREHVERFFFSMGVLRMPTKWSKEEIEKAIVEVVRSCPADEGYIRPIAFYGEHLGLLPKGEAHVAIASWAWPAYMGKEEIRLQTVSIRRISPAISVPKAKIGGHYVNSLLASFSVDRSKFDDALMLDTEGYVAEAPVANVFAVKGDEVIAAESDSILPGITRETLLVLAEELGLRAKREKMKREDLFKADEVFICGTAVEVCAVVGIDDRVIGSGKIGSITRQLREAYLKEVRGQGKHREWLTFV